MTSPDCPPCRAALPRSGSTKVLVVEDDPGIASQLVRGLSRSGYEVDHVTTGGDALSCADPDVVLLDLGLPDHVGIGAAQGVAAGRDVIDLVSAAAQPSDQLAGDHRGDR